ncbi:MAG: hypothetical protein NZM29_06185 [Nitrospira sp.]|nr:hypothetical protein [Nitrospira sp.]
MQLASFQVKGPFLEYDKELSYNAPLRHHGTVKDWCRETQWGGET